MPIRYNGNLIIPAPFVSVEKSYDKIGDKHVGAIYNINLRGKMLPCQGSPTTTGWHTDLNTDPASEPSYGAEDQRLKALLLKKELMRALWADEGQLLEIIPVDNDTDNMAFCYPRVNNMSFPEGEQISWFQYMDYTIALEADNILGPTRTTDSQGVDVSGVGVGSGATHEWFKTLDETQELYLRDVSETWNLEFNDAAEGVMPAHAFRLTHSLSATGKRHYDDTGLLREAWENAKLWVGERLGIDTDFAHLTQGFNLPDYYGGFNHVRTENTNEAAGTYEITETWILSSGNTLEDFTVSTQASVESSKTTVRIEGRITGMETRDTSNFFNVTTDKYTAADTKFSSLVGLDELFTRCQTYSGISLNNDPFDYQIQRNPTQGYVAYNYTYDDRQSNCISGALTENFEITDENYDKTVDVFASIPILGRSEGPILQDMNTTTERRRTLAVDALMPLPTGCPDTEAGVTLIMGQSPRGQVDTIVTAFSDHLTNVLSANQKFVERDTESWNPKTGRYTRNVVWVWQECPP